MYILKASLPSNKSSLVIFDQCMESFMKVFEHDRSKGFIFAMHEAIINSIQAAERTDNIDSPLTVIIEVDKERIVGRVIDQCGGIPDEKKTEISESSFNDILSMSGRGFLLINHFVDELSCNGIEDEFTIQMAVRRLEGDNE